MLFAKDSTQKTLISTLYIQAPTTRHVYFLTVNCTKYLFRVDKLLCADLTCDYSVLTTTDLSFPFSRSLFTLPVCE